jgi:hypothetical protein
MADRPPDSHWPIRTIARFAWAHLKPAGMAVADRPGGCLIEEARLAATNR